MKLIIKIMDGSWDFGWDVTYLLVYDGTFDPGRYPFNICPSPLRSNPTYKIFMPSFVCDHCQETLKKAKLDQHSQRCRQAVFSCIDCYKTFKGVEYRDHFSCITEVQKYHQKTPKVEVKPPTNPQPQVKKSSSSPIPTPTPTPAQIDSEFTTTIKNILKSNSSADFKVVKKELKKKLGKKSKKELQKKIIFSLDKDTKELVIKLEN